MKYDGFLLCELIAGLRDAEELIRLTFFDQEERIHIAKAGTKSL